MPDLVRVKSNLRSRVTGFAFHLFDLAAYEFLYRLSPARVNKFFNGGYLPLADDFIALPALSGEDHCAMMYHFVARSHLQGLEISPRRVLDVGCGQGGGVIYAAALYPKAHFTGIDRNATVIRRARRNLADHDQTRFLKNWGTSLDFAENSFDFVMSVGAPTYFGLTRFVAEVDTVLEPGGLLSFSGGYRQGDHQLIEQELRDAGSAHGFELLRYSNITPHTFASLKADIPRRIEQVNRVPWPFRLYGQKWADLPGSTEYQEYEDGRRADFGAVMRKRKG